MHPADWKEMSIMVTPTGELRHLGLRRKGPAVTWEGWYLMDGGMKSDHELDGLGWVSLDEIKRLAEIGKRVEDDLGRGRIDGMTAQELRDRYNIPELTPEEQAEVTQELMSLFAKQRQQIAMAEEILPLLDRLLWAQLGGIDSEENRQRALGYAGASPEFIEWFITEERGIRDRRNANPASSGSKV